MIRFKETTLVLMITAAATSSIACSNASAMAKKKAEAATSATTTVVIGSETSGSVEDTTEVGAAVDLNEGEGTHTQGPTLEHVSTGNYRQGLELGHNNGQNMVGRLRTATVDTKGCGAVDELEHALLAVSRTVRAPSRSDANLVRGFYRGYIDAIREGVQEARTGCEVETYEEGDFAGELYGAILCRATTVSIDIATSIELVPLYDGWSGGSSQVVNQCETAATIAIKSCSTASQISDTALTSLLVSLQVGCSDI